MGIKVTTESFIKKAIEIHGDKYDYSKVDYKKAVEKIEIKCPVHGLFYQTPNAHTNGSGCPLCGRGVVEESRRSDVNSFVKKSRKIHGNKYDYSKTVYNGWKGYLEISCPIHGKFTQEARKHLGGNGCAKCVHDNLKSNTEEFIVRSKKIHGDKYDYSNVEYVGCYDKVKISCPTHGTFFQKPVDHLNKKRGCKSCGKNTSKKEIEWLDILGIDIKSRNIYLNLSDGNRVCVDGFDEKGGIVYEFYGDFFHGNPKIYKEDDLNPLLKKTFGELYEKTIEKEKKILKFGYKLVTIWECEFEDKYKNKQK